MDGNASEKSNKTISLISLKSNLIEYIMWDGDCVAHWTKTQLKSIVRLCDMRWLGARKITLSNTLEATQWILNGLIVTGQAHFGTVATSA